MFTSPIYLFHWSSVVVNHIVMIIEAWQAFSTESESSISWKVTNLFCFIKVLKRLIKSDIPTYLKSKELYIKQVKVKAVLLFNNWSICGKSAKIHTKIHISKLHLSYHAMQYICKIQPCQQHSDILTSYAACSCLTVFTLPCKVFVQIDKVFVQISKCICSTLVF